MAQSRTKDMTQGPILPLIVKFSLPLLMGNLFQQTYNLVDTAIVGQTLGAKALAAVGSSTSIQFLVMGFCIGMSLGFSIPVGQRFGAKDYSGMHRYEYAGGILAALFAALVTLLTTVFCNHILHLLQVPEEIFHDAWVYLIIIFCEIPFTVMYNYLAGLMRAIGDSKTPFIYLAAASVLNIGLDFLFIVNVGMGVAGAALATVLSQALLALLCLYAVARRYDVLHIEEKARHYDFLEGRDLMGIGIPMGLQYSITAIGSMVMQSANNSLGTQFVSAFTAGTKIKLFLLAPFDAFATAVSTFVAQNFGARQTDRIRKGIYKGTIVSVLYGAIFGLFAMILWGRDLCLLFLDAANTVELDLAALYLRRMGYCLWVLGILNVCRMSIQGLGNARKAMMSGVLEMIARTVVSVLFVGSFGYDAITWADQAAWFAATFFVVPMVIYSIRNVEQHFKGALS